MLVSQYTMTEAQILQLQYIWTYSKELQETKEKERDQKMLQV